jgi:hypothetical protein
LEELGGWGKRNAVSRLNQPSKNDLEGNGSFKVCLQEGVIDLSGERLVTLEEVK